MKILHLCIGLYNFWTTYEGEYLNEAFMERNDVDFKVWGRDRLFYQDGMNACDVVKHLYGNDKPDVILVHSTLQKHEHAGDRKLLEGLETLRKNCIIVWRVFDCFDKRLKFYVDQLNKFKPQIALAWYPDHAQTLQAKVGNGTKVCFFPHSIGRRYFSKNADRSYDLALIGRCEKSVSDFKGIKVYTPPERKDRAEKGNKLIDDLNMCKFSWNSPVLGKYASLRFVESPACGTVSMVTNYFSQLDYYFPKNCYVVCDSNPSKCSDIIKNMSRDEFLSIQQRAYKVVIGNHTTSKRVKFIIDLVKGSNTEARNYFEIT